MILEREFYKSISTTRAIAKSLRAYLFTSARLLIKGRPKALGAVSERCLPELSSSGDCTLCRDCELICPTKSLELKASESEITSFLLDVKSCIFCGLCEEVCEPKVITLTDSRALASHGESLWKIDLVENNDEE